MSTSNFKTFSATAVLSLGFLLCGYASAATITVTSNADSGAGTLRQAINDINAGTGGDTIVFALSAGNETIAVASQLPNINNTVTIDGSNTEPGGSGTKVTVQVASPGVSPWRVFYINSSSGGAVTLSKMKIRGGNIPIGMAGAIQINGATVNLTGVTISDSVACQGGAIHLNGGTLSIDSSTITNNATNKSGACESHGGFIYNLGGTIKVDRSKIIGNSAKCGGAIFNATGNGKLTVTDSEISGNSGTCNGGVYNEGTATISSSTVSGNTSGGDGGGIMSWGTLTIVSSTIAGNVAANNGGGIYKGGTLTLVSSTISGNVGNNSAGGGIYNNNGFSHLLSSIIVGNAATDGADIYLVSVHGISEVYAYFSWFVNATGVFNERESAPNIKRALTAGDLASLGDNGGSTKTMAVSPSAPAAGRGAFAYYNATDGFYFLDSQAVPVSHKLTNWGTSPTVKSEDKITSDQRGVAMAAPTTIGAFYTGPAYFKITGHVRLNGTGKKGATVSDGTRTTTTGDDGSYELTGLLNWTGVTVTPSLSGGYTFTPVGASVTISGTDAINVDFDVNTVSMSMASDPAGGGSTTPSGTATVPSGVKQDISAAPANGYHFNNWNCNSGTAVIEDTASASTRATLSTDAQITAYFTINTYNLDYAAGANGSITGNQHQVVEYGKDGSSVTATPDPNYEFLRWSDFSIENPRQDKNVTASISVTALFQKIKPPSTTALGSSKNPSKSGDMVKFTATVTPGDATGTVVFIIDMVPMDSVPVVSGVAEYQIDSLSVGSHTVKAAYGGDSSYNGSESEPLTQYVDKAPVITKNPGDMTVTYGDTVNFPSDANGTPEPTAQWQVSTNGGSNWSDMTGEVGKVLSFAAQGSMNGYKYHAVYTNRAGSATTNSATLTVNKAAAIVSLSNLAQIFDGNPKSVNVTTVPPGLTVDVTYDGTSTPPTNVKTGGYAVVATINDVNYAGSNTGTLVISKGTATVSLSNLAQIYDGNPKSATVTTVPSGLAVDVTYDASSTPPTNVKTGGYAVVATISENNYTGSNTGTLVISKGAATVNLSNLTQVYDGSPKNATVTTVPSGLAVDVTYDGSSTPPTNVKTGGYAVVATISDNNYTGSNTGTLVVSKGTATVNLSNLAQTYDGSPKSVTATTDPAGLTVSIKYNGSSTAPTNAGSYAVIGTILDANYEGSGGDTLVISKASATVALGNLTQTYDGTPRSITATTTPSGLAVEFKYNGSATAPTNAGSYAAIGTINDTNYQGSGNGTLTVYKATASVTLGSLTQTYNGTPRSATAVTNPAGLEVVFTYDGGSATPINAGSYAVIGTISDQNYQGSGNGTLQVYKAVAVVTLAGLAQSYDGSAKNVTATTNPAGLSVAITYDGSSTAPVNVGKYAVVGTIVDTNYQGHSEGTLTVSKAVATVVLQSSSNPTCGQTTIVFTATVSTAVQGIGTPTGNVTFKDGTTVLGTVSLSGGTATYETSGLSAGLHMIAAEYSGDSSFAGIVSNIIEQVVGQVPVVKTQPVDSESCTGTGTNLSVEVVAGAAVHYQWYKGTAGDTSNPVGTDSATLAVSGADAGSYWVRATSFCGTVDSTAAAVTIASSPVILDQPVGREINSGETATLNVSAKGSSTLHYAWYQGLSGDTSKPVGTDNALFTTPELLSTTAYWVEVGNSCGKTASTAAVVVVSGGLVVQGGCSCSTVGDLDDGNGGLPGLLLSLLTGALALIVARKTR